MHRRAFLTATLTALALPFVAHAEPADSHCGTARRTFQHRHPGDGAPASLSVAVLRQGGLVAPLPTEDELLAPVIASGHERAGMEFSIVSRETLPAPTALDLDAIFVGWISLEGAAAVRRAGSVGTIRDDDTQWTIAIGGGDWPRGDLLGDVALTVSKLASGAEPGTGASLLDLLPSAADLPGWRQSGESLCPEPCGR